MNIATIYVRSYVWDDGGKNTNLMHLAIIAEEFVNSWLLRLIEWILFCGLHLFIILFITFHVDLKSPSALSRLKNLSHFGLNGGSGERRR